MDESINPITARFNTELVKIKKYGNYDLSTEVKLEKIKSEPWMDDVKLDDIDVTQLHEEIEIKNGSDAILESTCDLALDRLKNSSACLKCQNCSKVFDSEKKIKNHMRRVHSTKKIPCDSCGKMFLHKSDMLVHKEKVHLKNYTFRCDKCDKGFFMVKDLQTHTRVHHDKEPFKCEVCGKPYLSEGNYKLHVLTHDPDRKKTYVCPQCDKVFDNKYKFHRHKKEHLAEGKPKIDYVCETCGKSMASKCILKNHMNTHKGVKSHKCDVCQELLSSRGCLQTHMRIHTNEKPYGCNVCGKRFRQKPPLTIHMRTHTGEKPYQCPNCNKNFISKSVLNTHKCYGPL